MNRTDKNRQLRHQIKEERDNLYKTEFVCGETFEYTTKIISDKLDDICDRLEELSKHLYWIAKYDSILLETYPLHSYSQITEEAEPTEISKMFDDVMGHPMQELDKLFEVKK